MSSVRAMRTLFLLRHAKSSWSDPTLADQERPLSARGRRDAKRIARHLAQLAIEPDLVLCSPAQRTRETLDLVRPALDASTSMIFEVELYGASADTLLDQLRGVPDGVESVLLIGHNPGVQDLALCLASEGVELNRLEEKFPTAALAILAVPKVTWAQLSEADAVLEAFVVPRQLD